MKKKILLFVALVSMIFMSGCGTKNNELKPIDVLEKSVKSLNDIKSIEVVSTLSAVGSEEGTKFDMNIPLTIAGSGVKDGLLMKLSLGDNPFIGGMEAYVSANTKNENIEMYIPSSIIDSIYGIKNEKSKWLYVNASDLMGEDVSISIDEEELNKIKDIDYKKIIGDNFVYVDSNEGINHYQLIINDEFIKRLPGSSEVLDTVGDTKDSAAKSEATMIVSGINNYCAIAAMKEQLDGTKDICKDGVTKDEVSTMIDLGETKVNSITYNGKVTSLEVESNGRTVTYDGSIYSISKKEADELGVEIKLDVYIDAKNYNITKIGFDLKEMLVNNEVEVEDIEMFEEFTFTMEFKNINNTTVTIPEDVKNSAISIEEYAEEISNLVES